MGPFSLIPLSKKSPVSITIFFANFTRVSRVFTVALPMLLKVAQFQPSFAFCIEASNFICNPNSMTVFYVRCNTGLKWISFGQEFFNNSILIT